jgi:hypothetical protein
MLEQPVRFAVSFQLPQVSEILVDDVEICEVLPGGKEGPNLATHPSASLNAEGTPPGWGYYSGDGKGEWGIASPGRTDERCVRVKALKPHANGVMNVALLVGESDGYKGPRALLARRGAAYKIRFWIKGNAPIVNVHAVTWPHDPNSSNDRSNVNAAQVSATGDWVRQEGTFTLPSGPMGLENLREAAGDAPWRITWRLDKDYRFAAFSPGGRGEKVVIGNGWGQRDYRNTDRGAVLPYILRCCEGKGLNQFVSVFVGEPKGRALIKGVRHIPLPEGAPPDAAAIEVQTAAGTDIVVSMLTPRPITLPTSLGEVTTDGRAALVSGDGKPAAAVLVGGTQLTCSGAELQCLRGAYGGKVLNIGGDRGESWFAVSGELPDTKEVVGGTLFIEDGPTRRAYPIRKIATKDGQTLVYTKVDNVGFQARPGTSWEFIPTKIWTRPR